MIDARFIVNLKGKDFILYAGLLDAATAAGLKSLTTRIVQVPAAENGHMAVMMARAEFGDGRVFEDVGDCSPANCSPQIATAALRMASTRAKGRCLRDALSIGSTMFEELPPDMGDELSPPAAVPITRNGKGHTVSACEVCGQMMTQARATLTRRNYGHAVCADHEPFANERRGRR